MFVSMYACVKWMQEIECLLCVSLRLWDMYLEEVNEQQLSFSLRSRGMRSGRKMRGKKRKGRQLVLIWASAASSRLGASNEDEKV